MSLESEDARGRGRPRMTWSRVVGRDMRECGLRRDDALDRVKCQGKLSWGTTGRPLRKRENCRKTFVGVVVVIYDHNIRFMIYFPGS